MKFLFTLFSIIAFSAQAQNIEQEINQQVWKKFVEAYNTFDTEKFMSVYSKDVIRVPVDEKKIFSFTEYKKNINRENQFNKNYKIRAKLELRFTERIHYPAIAYETGIFKISLIDNNGQPATLYSKFHVLITKEAGLWKIKFDSDSTEGNSVGEKEFQAAKAME